MKDNEALGLLKEASRILDLVVHSSIPMEDGTVWDSNWEGWDELVEAKRLTIAAGRALGGTYEELDPQART